MYKPQNHYSLWNYLYWVWEVFFNLVKKIVDHIHSLGILTDPSIYFDNATLVGMIGKFKYLVSKVMESNEYKV